MKKQINNQIKQSKNEIWNHKQLQLLYIQRQTIEGKMMRCPARGCRTLLVRDEGCEWVQCPACALEICWITQQPRWGPKVNYHFRFIAFSESDISLKMEISISIEKGRWITTKFQTSLVVL